MPPADDLPHAPSVVEAAVSNAPDRPTTAEVRGTGALPPEADAPMSEAAIENSTPFVGRWNELVSTTNWEKGRIISDWRNELERSGAAVTEYSDEAWARLVGGVTSQHVGRLRRAHERFSEVYKQYPGLYWSHFQAGLDWPDAEMWLEGAITNGWSVSQMRAGRWEAVGDPTDEEPQVIETSLDEEGYTALVDRETPTSDSPTDSAQTDSAQADKSAAPNSSDASARDVSDEGSASSVSDSQPIDDTGPTAEAVPRVQPFKDLAALPDDIADAFEQFKLAILTHKLTGWQEVSRDDLLGALESLRVLALAPSDND